MELGKFLFGVKPSQICDELDAVASLGGNVQMKFTGSYAYGRSTDGWTFSEIGPRGKLSFRVDSIAIVEDGEAVVPLRQWHDSENGSFIGEIGRIFPLGSLRKEELSLHHEQLTSSNSEEVVTTHYTALKKGQAVIFQKCKWESPTIGSNHLFICTE